jgi:hypothetical protein
MSRSKILCRTLALAMTAAFGLSTAFADDHELGYDDTPQLPNCKWRVHDIKRPQPKKVEPGDKLGAPPADAVVLFDGKDLSEWDGANAAGVEDGVINIKKAGQITTKKQFGDCQLHIEWATPNPADAPQGDWGNSGVYMLGKYEIQVIESHDSANYADGMAASVYGQTPPAVNVARKPGEWQSYDIAFTTPKFDGDKLVSPAYATVFWNGVLVQNHTPVLGPTVHALLTNYDATRETTGPILLQMHGSAVKYRNIWIRPFKPAE